jgi:hypothetical protein
MRQVHRLQELWEIAALAEVKGDAFGEGGCVHATARVAPHIVTCQQILHSCTSRTRASRAVRVQY